MTAMNEAELTNQINLLNEIGDNLIRYCQLDARLMELRDYAQRDNAMSHFNSQKAESAAQELFNELNRARSEVGRRTHEVTDILYALKISTTWLVHPPPAFGGYIRQFNVFEAFVDYELKRNCRPSITQVTDLLDKGVWALERELQKKKAEPTVNLAPVKRTVGRILGELYNGLFRTETQKSILGWLLLGLLAVLLLRLLGFDLQTVVAAVKTLVALFK